MEGIPSYEELSPGAERAAKRKRSVEIVETTNSPNTADKEARRLRFKDENRIDCWNLARMKKYYPDKYQELISKNAVQKKVEKPASVPKPPKKNWRKWTYVGTAIVVCLAVLVGGLILRGNDDQKTSEQSEQVVASPVEEPATPPIISTPIISAPIVYPNQIKPAVGIPNLLAPINGTKDVPVEPVGFSWSSVPGAYFYEFALSGDPEFKEENVVARVLAPTSACNLVTHTKGGLLKDVCLNYSTSYFWRVRAFNNRMETGGWSNINTFATEAAPPYAP